MLSCSLSPRERVRVRVPLAWEIRTLTPALSQREREQRARQLVKKTVANH